MPQGRLLRWLCYALQGLSTIWPLRVRELCLRARRTRPLLTLWLYLQTLSSIALSAILAYSNSDQYEPNVSHGSPGKRREMDLMKLMMSDWKVDLVNDCVNEFTVIFKGPSDSELSIRIICCSASASCACALAPRAAGFSAAAQHHPHAELEHLACAHMHST